MGMAQVLIRTKSTKYIFGVSFIVVLLCLYMIFMNYNNKYKEDNNGIKNDLVLGHLKVEGTNIDYQIKNYSVYLEEGENITDETLFFYDKDSILKSDNNVVLGRIWGHNIKNLSATPLISDPTHMRFEQLLNFTDYNFASENQKVYLSTDTEMEFVVFAAGFIPNEFLKINSNLGKIDLDIYIEKAFNYSFYDYDIDVNSDDKIILLNTCTRSYGYRDDVIYGVFARKLRDDEIAGNVNIKINEERLEIE